MSGSLVSLDVFDTVLVRKVGEPAAVFVLAGRLARERLQSAIDPFAFAEKRMEAEHAVRQRAHGGEITLDQISGELALQLGLNHDVAGALTGFELASETQLIGAAPEAQAWLDSLRLGSPRLIFVSDMYLPAEFIRGRLVDAGCWRDGDRLYVSSEEGASKISGRLFQRILAEEKIPAISLRHFGNHADSDLAVPSRLGIQAVLRPAGNLNRYEMRLGTFARATNGWASVHAGSSRLARMEVTAPAGREAIRDVAAGVAAPVMSSYASWVLRDARQRGINRLYFVARDGHVLLELARQLAPSLHPGAELRYLYGSRQAWHLPGVFTLGEAELDWLFCPTDFLSIANVCARVSVDPAKISEPLATAGFSPADWERNLSSAERARLRLALQLPAAAEKIVARAAAARGTLLEYLAQEGLLTSGRCALVDVGWHGRAQDSLAKVIRAAGFAAPDGYYFGLNSASGLTGLGERHAWLFDRRIGRGLNRTFPGIEPLVETFCTATHGPTLEYFIRGARVEPVLGAAPAALEDWGWATLHETLAAYGRYLAAAPHRDTDEEAVRDMSAEMLKLFWQAPTRAEAQAWGSFPYEDEQASSASRPLAHALPWGQAQEIILRGRTGPHRASWWHGSRELTPPLRRAVLTSAFQLRNWARTAWRKTR